jgi:hypothetical protein
MKKKQFHDGLTHVELKLRVEPCWEKGMTDCFVVHLGKKTIHTGVADNREYINNMLKLRDKKAKEKKRAKLIHAEERKGFVCPFCGTHPPDTYSGLSCLTCGKFMEGPLAGMTLDELNKKIKEPKNVKP